MLVKICSIQMSSYRDKEKTLQKALEFLSMAAKSKVNIACFPELFLTEWFPQYEYDSDFRNLAEDLDGKTIMTMQTQAKKYGMVIIVPFYEIADSSAYYNSVAVIDENGTVLGVYRKVHLPNFPYYREKSYFLQGKDFPVFITTFGTVGIQTGWDNFYPEMARILALKGAEIVFAPTASAFSTNNKWILSISANAFLNGFFDLRVNRVGRDGDLDFYGKSFCVSPSGSVVDKDVKTNECVTVYNIRTEEVKIERENWPFLENRSGESYSEILK